MAGFKAKLLLGLMRRSHLFKLQLKRPPFDSSIEGIQKFRVKTEKAGKLFGKLPEEIKIGPEPISDMYAEWVKLNQVTSDKAILYFHGGMYLIGSAQSHRAHVSKFVLGSAINAFVFNYRLAPEHPFPAALDDSIKAYNHLLNKGIKPSNIAFAGDSAGAGLCLATLLALKEKKMELPAAAAVLSPWTDLMLTGKSYVNNADICLSPKGSAEHSSNLYAKDMDKTNPLISPLYGDLKGLPPLHMSAGSNEILLDDSIQFAEKAKKAGVDVKLVIGDGMCHCYPVFSNVFKESKETMNEICNFLKTNLKND